MFIKRCLTFAFVLSGVVGFLGFTPHAEALTVSPVKLELRGDPGATVGSSFMLINEQDSEQTFFVSFANFEAQGESGTPQFVDSADGLATWIRLVPNELNSVTLAAGASQNIYFEVTIPEDATPGGHFSAIFWGTSPASSEDSVELGLGAKVGILAFLSVNGAVEENGGLLEFGVQNNQKVFTEIPVNFFYRFQNDGGDRVVPLGSVFMKNTLGIKTDTFSANPSESNVLPLSVRRFETTWGESPTVEVLSFWQHVQAQWDQFAFGYYKAELSLTYGSEQEHVSKETSFWVLPWQLLLVSGSTILVVLLFGTFVIRRYNRWIIAQAIAASRTKPTSKKRL